jgi:Tc toxin complex TcA C-terminal TcB-binding domain
VDVFSNAWLSYSDLAGTKLLAKKSRQYDEFSSQETTKRANPDKKPTSEVQLLTSLSGLAFCIPRNDKLVGYYDLIDQRLFNIRHCRNIDGIYRDLPLYDPPIDPLLLIKARAADLDIESVLTGLYAPLPSYRFNFTLQKAVELCAEVKALGAALLAALEKQDAEDLALLRSSQEIAMLKLVRDVRQRQVDEAAANIVALQQSQATVMERFNQFQKLLGKTNMTTGQDGSPVVEQSSALTVSTDAVGEASGLGLSRKEINQFMLSAMANEFTQQANTMHVLSGILSIIPNLWSGDALVAGSTFGGSNLESAASAIAKAIEMGAVNSSYLANQMGTFGGYERRQDEWVYQSKLALAELKQLDKQILAATIRQDIAQHELENHDTQIDNATAIDDFMRSKFSSRELHRWMSSQIAQVYFSTYQLALDQARRAELAYQYELGVDAASAQFVQSDYWDNLKRRLLAGEHLHHDLKRMESAYLERNTREFEITKHISLLQLNPFAFIQLKETGSCDFDVPEALFDMDYPGHYFRRIKMVSLSIPCVAGPYSSVSATLKLNKSQTRVKSNEDSYKRLPEAQDDPRFTKTISAITAIVTSSAQQDSGMFEPNLRDERYLPFEGSGAISSWTLTLPDKFRPFDYDTISDVLLHFRYTSRDGGEDLKTASEGDLDSALKNVKLQSDKTGLARLFSLRHEFPTEWYRFLHPQADYAGDQILTIGLVKERLSFLFSQTTINLQSIELYVRIDADFADSYTDTTLKLALKAGTTASATLLNINIDDLTGLLHAEKSPAGGSLGNWTLTAWLAGTPHLRLDPDAIQDIFLVCRYTCTSS